MKRRLLTVEDDPDILQILSDILALAGFDVIGASSATEAWEKSAQQAFDAVICDIMLPDRAGPALVADLVAARGRLPVLYISADVERAASLIGSSCSTRFLAKPFRQRDLIAAVESLFAPPAPAGSPGEG